MVSPGSSQGPRSHLEPLGKVPQSPQANAGRSALGPPRSPSASSTGLAPLRRTGSINGSTHGGTMAAQQLDSRDNVKVVMRVRPLFEHEQDKSGQGGSVVHIGEDMASVKVVVPGPGGATMQRDFQFHACLGPDTCQQEVMQLCGIQQLLDAALAGYNVTIFAYGQTGSGKTYTMSGREEAISDDMYSGDLTHDGIVSRAVHYLFNNITQRSDAKYSLRASYLEIYNEGIYDLVNWKKANLPVKWDAAQGFYVQGLKVVPCSSQNTMMEVIRTGMKHRKVGSHELNMESSRSHSIFTVYCHATPTDPSSYDYGTMRYGKVSFVDLAGSERQKDTRSEGQTLKEAQNINKSLFTLGKVIAALADNQISGTSAHIPYRDSKLTKLLMDSLGGSALALMIACCSPSALHVEETLSTLSYAMRAKNIHNRPTVQYDPREGQIAVLRREIELLRHENQVLREQLRLGPLAPAPPGGMHLQEGMAQMAAAARGALAQRPSSMQSATAAQQHAATMAMASVGKTAEAPPRLEGGLHLTAGHESAADLVASLRSNSSPSMTLLAKSLPGGLLRHSTEALRTSSRAEGELVQQEAAAGAPAVGSELYSRLQETQVLLARFSEENGRLAQENYRLRAGRQMLSVEHGDVLEEIDMLRSKLSQLETAVLAGGPGAAAAAEALHNTLGGARRPSSRPRALEPINPALLPEPTLSETPSPLGSGRSSSPVPRPMGSAGSLLGSRQGTASSLASTAKAMARKGSILDGVSVSHDDSGVIIGDRAKLSMLLGPDSSRDSTPRTPTSTSGAFSPTTALRSPKPMEAQNMATIISTAGHQPSVLVTSNPLMPVSAATSPAGRLAGPGKPATPGEAAKQHSSPRVGEDLSGRKLSARAN